MATQKADSTPYLKIFLLSACLIYALLDVVSDYNVNYRYQQAQCRVVSHKLEKYRPSLKGGVARRMFSALIGVEFAVNSQQYQVWALGSRMYTRKVRGQTAQSIFSTFPKDIVVPCWYDPASPATTLVLEQGYHTASIAFLIGLALYLIANLFFFYVPRTKHILPKGKVDRSGLFKVNTTLLTNEYYYIGNVPVTKDILPPELKPRDSGIYLLIKPEMDSQAESYVEQLSRIGVLIAIRREVKLVMYSILFVGWALMIYGFAANLILFVK